MLTFDLADVLANVFGIIYSGISDAIETHSHAEPQEEHTRSKGGKLE